VITRLVDDDALISNLDGRIHHLVPVAAPPAEGEALQRWVTKESASHTIEIGLGYGLSALFVCEALLRIGSADVRHVVIDPYQATRFANCGLQVLDEAGVAGIVEHHAEESQIALPRFLAEGRAFDLAFVDGNHLFDKVFLDLVYLGRLVRRGGIVFVDDYQFPAVRRAVSFCVSNLGWALEEASIDDPLHHWAVLRTSENADERHYDHYVDF
jgi:predicted O-methyltransferase YrrM